MAKTKTPFFSLGAHGSVGEAITAQKRGKETLLREKPLPTDPYSLPQAYQRWLYEDYAYLWTQQSAATQAEYRSAGVRFHLTGFQYWMKTQLPLFTDIAGWWYLDEKSGAVAHDRTPNANNGTIIGASFADGRIDGALLFDAVNDLVNIPSVPSLNITQAITLECFVYLLSYTPGGTATDRSTLITKPLALYMTVTSITGKLAFYLAGEAPAHVDSNSQVPLNRWVHCAVTYDGINARWYINGALDKTLPWAGPFGVSASNVNIGGELPTYRFTDGSIDHALIHSRALDDTEIKRHSERSYPA